MKRTELQNNLAMTMILISGAMLFATLFMGYAIFRSSANTWPPVGSNKTAIGWPLLSTVTILLSSWFCHQVKLALEAKNFAKAKMDLNLTIILGLFFMVIQCLLWSHLKASGMFVGSGIFSSLLYGFTWIHAAHMVCGIATLIWLKMVFRPSDDGLLHKAINVGKFWHFLGIIWIIMFLTLFVI